MNYFLYGPPLTGKSTLGQSLAAILKLPFIDMDDVITTNTGRTIADIFQKDGESVFRALELEAIEAVIAETARASSHVIALGGGALLNPEARILVEENGQVLCLEAPLNTLLARTSSDSTIRPLLAGDQANRLGNLLRTRESHYRSFPLRLSTDSGSVEELTWKAQVLLGAFRVSGMGQPYDIRTAAGSLARIGSYCQERKLKSPMIVVTDANIGPLHGETVINSLRNAGYEASLHCIEPGEEHKNIETILKIWDAFIKAGIERSSTVIALGGGVVGDMTGFAAATFLRGVPWVNVPTSLLSMVDSSLGGKTGIDLPQAKNLVGAFYPPRLVLADPLLLETLPPRELRNGMAEVVKHGVIGDPELYALCGEGLEAVKTNITKIVCQGMALKVKVIEIDPFEKGIRQSLNLGHTIGHGVEISSGFGISHGEAVSIGMVAEATLAEHLGLAESGLKPSLVAVLSKLGLPTQIPDDISIKEVSAAMLLDKKRAAGKIHFALPVRIGEVKTGVVIEDWQDQLSHL